MNSVLSKPLQTAVWRHRYQERVFPLCLKIPSSLNALTGSAPLPFRPSYSPVWSSLDPWIGQRALSPKHTSYPRAHRHGRPLWPSIEGFRHTHPPTHTHTHTHTIAQNTYYWLVLTTNIYTCSFYIHSNKTHNSFEHHSTHNGQEKH